MYPKFMAKDAAAYFTQWNKLFTEGPISTKEARLSAIAAEVARFSTLLYGDDFGQQNLKNILGIE